MGLFQIIKCYSCNTFQVHQAGKATKWQCKICSEKQSLKRIYFESHAAKDCRVRVQALNLKRKNAPSPQHISEEPAQPAIVSGDSKWKRFKVDEDEPRDEGGEDLFSSLAKSESGVKVSINRVNLIICQAKSTQRNSTSKRYQKPNNGERASINDSTNANKWNKPVIENSSSKPDLEVGTSRTSRLQQAFQIKRSRIVENSDNSSSSFTPQHKTDDYCTHIQIVPGPEKLSVRSHDDSHDGSKWTSFNDAQPVLISKNICPENLQSTPSNSKWASFNDPQPVLPSKNSDFFDNCPSVPSSSKWSAFSTLQQNSADCDEEGTSLW